VRDGLRDLDRFVGAKDSAGFHALVFRLLQEQLGERLNLPAAAITEAVIEEQLQPRGVEAVLQRDLHELFQACNQARYAPPGSTRELRALKPKVERVLKALQEVEV
jgi:hypothetical protein